ncbi:MAG: nitronate monooxygenase [Chloroflexi bacterium]|nr:MAG: nitronate monooxygenase [Chloroflexota bacterium]
MDLVERLGLERPVVQAGMGGGLATAELAAAVSSAGGLGTVGLMPPRLLQAELRAASSRVAPRPVAANLIVPFMRSGHVEAIIGGGAKLAVLSFGFRPAAVAALRHAGVVVLHQVGTVTEARRALGDGADGLIAQGMQAGGHLVGVEPTLDFLPRALEAAGGRPVLAAGGIHDRTTAAAAMSAGAAAVVGGTRFLLTDECHAHLRYKQRVCGASRTIVTTLFGLGWPLRHRVVPNAATERWLRSGREPAWMRYVCSASGVLGRLVPMDAVSSLAATRVPWMPPSAAPVLAGQPEGAVDLGPLYAGECARHIDAVVPAGVAVAALDPG